MAATPMPLAVVTRRPPDASLAPLERVAVVEVWDGDESMPRDRLLRALSGADGLYCMLVDSIDVELLDAAPRLRAVSTMAVGVDNIDLTACTARRIPVGHTPGVLTETTADTALALLLAAARRLVEGADFVRAGRWSRWDPDLLLGHDVHDTVLGVVGMGRIGQAVARRAAGFAMRILYSGPNQKPALDAALGARHAPLEELLAAADHVVVCAALTPATHHIIDAAALAAMKPTATLVNVGRGGLVDQAALAAALAGGVIAAAGLDVTDPEPVPADDPLLMLPNCVIIPHLGSASVATRQGMSDLAVANLVAALRGERMPACANPEVYGDGPVASGGEEQVAAVARLLGETAAAHHDAYRDTGGVDPTWPLWYADNTQSKLASLLGVGVSRSDLVTWYLEAARAHPQEAPEEEWTRFYANRFVAGSR